MRFTGLHISGFGLFQDLTIEDLSPSLTVFLGKNESGKSTLLAFLRAVLFGFPDGRSNENPYPPFMGGRHGGNLTLMTDTHEKYVIERYSGPRGGPVHVLEPDQTRGGRAVLGRLLGGINRTLFKNIYAFSLTELQDFETLDTKAVRETLYSAGAGLDPKILGKFKGRLEKREGELFKPGGRKPEINLLLSRLNAIQGEKRALQGSVEAYDRIRSGVSAGTREIRFGEERCVRLSVRLKKIVPLIQVWPDWIGLSLAKTRLEALEAIDAFPPQGISRFENLKARFADAQKGLAEKQADLDRLEKEIFGLRAAPGLLELGPEIHRLQRDQGHFESVTGELEALKEEISGRKERLQGLLRSLGAGWDEAKVLGFNLSLGLREEVRQVRVSLQQLASKVQRKKISHDFVLSEKHKVKEGLDRLKEPDIKDPKTLEAMKEACDRLIGHEARHQLLEVEVSHVTERLDELERERRSLVVGEGISENRPVWPIAGLAGAGVLYFAWAGFRNQWTWGAFIGGAALFSAFFFWFTRKDRQTAEKERARKIGERLAFLAERAKGFEERHREIVGERSHLLEAMQADRRILGFQDTLSSEGLQSRARELSERGEALNRWIKALADFDRIQKQEAGARSELEEAEAGYHQCLQTWQIRLNSLDLDAMLSPDGALESLGLMASCREQSDHLMRLRAKTVALEETRDAYRDLVNQVSLRSQVTPEDPTDIRRTAQDLIRNYFEVEQAEQKRTLLIKELGICRESVERLGAQVEALTEEMEKLLLSGGTDNEDRFRERALIYERRRDLKEDVEKCRANISRLSGSSKDIKSLEAMFTGLTLEDLEEQKTSIEGELKALEDDLDRMKKEQATAEEQLRQLIQDDRISVLRSEEEGLRENLSVLAEEWAVHRLARALIRMAGERYEKKRQPRVIAEAGRYLQQMTLGGYPSLASPFGENRIELVCRDHSRKEIGQLSRGTAEQLYLALRFGFIREFSKNAEPLPIIMDDILVNFDPPRARAAVKALLKFSRHHQILFFTCHPQTVRLFREADAHLSVMEVADGSVLPNFSGRKTRDTKQNA